MALLHNRQSFGGRTPPIESVLTALINGLASVIEAMKDWLDGIEPDTQDWESMGFLTSPPYDPPAWPFAE